MWKRVLSAIRFSVRWTFIGWHLPFTILYLGGVAICFVVEFLYPVGLIFLALLAAYMLLIALFKYLRDRRTIPNEG